MVTEFRCSVGNLIVNYAKIGRGSHYLLCLPGAIGSWQTDFKGVLEGFDHDIFTIVCWDPPGFGKSRPPDRDFSHGFNARDAALAFELMRTLELVPFSCLGWSDGGVTALHIAYQQRSNNLIRKVVIWGSTSYVTTDMVAVYRVISDTTKWSDKNRQPYVEMYGEKYMQLAWAEHLNLFERNDGNKCREILPFVTVPVMVLHGTRDIYVTKEHPDYLLRTLPNARMAIKESAGHNLHIQFFTWFRQHVVVFLQNADKLA